MKAQCHEAREKEHISWDARWIPGARTRRPKQGFPLGVGMRALGVPGDPGRALGSWKHRVRVHECVWGLGGGVRHGTGSKSEKKKTTQKP